MPTAHVNEIGLYYEVHGEGPNLTLIEGLGYDLWMWNSQLPAFSPHFRVLVYDNRGVGRSECPPGPYSHAQNATDLAALLDHLGWERTHVLGISMGGFIAQQFALDYPTRVDRLVLAATGFGGANMVPITHEAVAAMTPDPSLAPEERIRRAMPVAFSDQIVRWRLEHPQPPHAAMAQLLAGVNFDVESRVSEIVAPTLVMTGNNDQVVPAQNAELLVARIPNAELLVLHKCGHVLNIECAERFNQEVVRFLSDDGEAR